MASYGTCFILCIVAQLCLWSLLLMGFCSRVLYRQFSATPCLRRASSPRSPHTVIAVNLNLITPSSTSSLLSPLASVPHLLHQLLRHSVLGIFCLLSRRLSSFRIPPNVLRRHCNPYMTLLCPRCWYKFVAKSCANSLLRRIDVLVPEFYEIDTAPELRTLISV
ncbi:hypothetical protein M758_UG053400 [Ceratodon purpureus]|nr:hypothetical protein M758_UG053400 [Ceratodon purpureus]